MSDTRISEGPAPADERLETRVLAVVGPTAVGKSALAERLAATIGGEIVGADSMQVYRGMDIGTAKTPPASRLVPHYCVDLVDPGEPFSAALYQRVAREAIEEIASRGQTPVLAGGTGLYVRAALDDWTFPTGEAGTGQRERLEALSREIGPHAMHARLNEIDPEAASLIHPNNVRRVIRALEMAGHGVSYAEQTGGFARRESVYDAVFLGLTMDRELLYRRIAQRVDGMLEAGLLTEVRRLLSRGYREALTAAQAIGYKELVPVVEGHADLAEATEDIKRATRRYAKRQLTWFRADPRVRWLDVTGLTTGDVLDQAIRLVG